MSSKHVGRKEWENVENAENVEKSRNNVEKAQQSVEKSY